MKRSPWTLPPAVGLPNKCPICGAVRVSLSPDGKKGYCWQGHAFTAESGSM